MDHEEAVGPVRPRIPLAEMVVAGWVVLVAGLVLLGADLLWVVALGDLVREEGSIPEGVPFASAPQTDWPNPVVLAQVLLSVVHAGGWWALPSLHLVLVTVTLIVVVAEGRRMGGTDPRICAAVSLAVIGAASALVVVRFPSLSLVPFVLLVALLRRQDDLPGRGLWLVPALMVVWGNLHGAVLVGLAVLGVFVVAARGPSWRDRGVVGLASLACLVLTSAGFRTPQYYVSALGNEAAQRGTDLWARPDLSQPLDIALALAALALLLLAARSLRRWEWLVTLGLVVATLSAARHGVWLLLFLAPVAGVPPGRRTPQPADVAREAPRLPWRVLAVVGVIAVLLVGGQLVRRPDQLRPAGHELVGRLLDIAQGSPVLAVEPEAETFAQAGIRVWAANPLDAFTQATQAEFLDFLHGCRVPNASMRVVVVDEVCRATLSRSGWVVVDGEGGLSVLVKAPTG